jgi:MinD-like ATPase involved in chromosome partitioning or flagellar assembly
VHYLLNLLRHHVAFTVVDAPHVYSPAFLQAVTMADMGLHIITPEVVSVQTAVQLNRLLNKAGIQVKRKSHILNQHTPEAQLPQTAVERGLNNKVAFQIGYDINQARAIAQGVPLTLTSAKSGLPNVVRRMSEAIWQRVSTKSL